MAKGAPLLMVVAVAAAVSGVTRPTLPASAGQRAVRSMVAAQAAAVVRRELLVAQAVAAVAAMGAIPIARQLMPVARAAREPSSR